MIEQHDKELRNLCELYGIHGVIALMAEWTEAEGGLEFIQRVVAGLTEQKLQAARSRMKAAPTFREWQATRRKVSAGEIRRNYEASEDTAECYQYAGSFFIEIRERGFLVQLPGEQEESEDLEYLERRLFDFATEEGAWR